MRDLSTDELSSVSGAGLTPTQLDAKVGSVWRGISAAYPNASLAARVGAFLMTAEVVAVIALGTSAYALGTWIYNRYSNEIQDCIEYTVNNSNDLGQIFTETWRAINRTLPTD